MNIHEFEAKGLFRRAGIKVPQGTVCDSATAAAEAARSLGGGKAVVKAQIHAGGRGKGAIIGSDNVRGVRVVDSPEAAASHATALLGKRLRTHQTMPEGQVVKRVLVEAASDIAKELYAAVVLDRKSGRISFIVSTEGGMDIEQVAANTPDKICRLAIDPVTGFQPYHARRLTDALALQGDTAKQAADLLTKLYAFYLDYDASLVEINPLVVTGKGDIVALDAKLNFDDNALFRQPDIAALRDVDEEDPKERDARDANLSYVALQGNVGCLVNGAGLAMATMDIIKKSGGEPANFLDVGGGATAEMVTTAFKIIMRDPSVRAILVNIFGGIAKCDVIAEGVITATREVNLQVPLVVRLEGTNVEKGKKMLADSKLKILAADDMKDAAEKAVRASKGGAS